MLKSKNKQKKKGKNGAQLKMLFSCSGRQNIFALLINILGHAISKWQETVFCVCMCAWEASFHSRNK